jgi:predicted transcriptional regulator
MTPRKPLPNPAALFEHPIRMEIMGLVERELATSPSTLAKMLGRPVQNVAYHVRQLADAGWLMLSSTDQRRGAVVHYYAPTARWEQVGQHAQRMLVRAS